jgi:hypothetical protein
MPNFHQSYPDRLELALISFCDAVRNAPANKAFHFAPEFRRVAEAYAVNTFDLELVYYLKGEKQNDVQL